MIRKTVLFLSLALNAAVGAVVLFLIGTLTGVMVVQKGEKEMAKTATREPKSPYSS